MISYNAGQSLFQTLSQNLTTANASLYGQLVNIEHRYLLQKYFNNEGSFSISTIGSNSLSMASGLGLGGTSVSLAVAWAYPTCTTTVTFSDGEIRNVLFTNGSTSITWQVPLTGTQFLLTNSLASGTTSATLQTAWMYNTTTQQIMFGSGEIRTATFTNGSTAISWSGGLSSSENAYFNTSLIGAVTTGYQIINVGGVQFYRMPPNYSKLKDLTITVGNLKWTLEEVRTREEWDSLNVFPYYADIPKSFYIYPGGDHGGQIGIWPIPSTTGNIITFNYKFRIPDLSIADYTTPGTVSVTNGGSTVTGTSTTWTPTTNAGNESRWIQFAQPTGDNLWYQIASVDSATSLTLYQPYQGVSISGSSTFTIGQMPLIAEDFQDMLVFKALSYYFMSIVDNPTKREEYEDIYKTKLALLNEYSGSNTVQVNLSRRSQMRNPNLYPYGNLG